MIKINYFTVLYMPTEMGVFLITTFYFYHKKGIVLFSV
jgi:hypothetical protein